MKQSSSKSIHKMTNGENITDKKTQTINTYIPIHLLNNIKGNREKKVSST